MNITSNENAALAGAASQNDVVRESYNKPSISQENSAVLDIALQLAVCGLPVFPCFADKTPACPHGFKDATTDAATLRSFWGTSYRLIGVPTGEASGVDVLDIDPRHNGDEWLAANAGKLPLTRTHQTKSGGQHFYFRHKPGVRNSANKIAPGVDVRADGGYVIWWPATGLPVLNDTLLAGWPEWLLQKLLPPSRPPFVFNAPAKPKGTAYAIAALRQAAELVAGAPEGCRNDTLNREAFSLTRFTATGELHLKEVLAALADAGLSSGLDHREITITLASVLRARGIV